MPQPRGDGKLELLVEPSTGRSYYLYLPKEYVEADEAGRAAGRWPLVVTFHGMKPFDIAYYQAREWQQEADRYGYVVVAPALKTFVSLVGQFPLRTINAAFRSDEAATLAILDHVLAHTHAEAKNVLSTSWSSGGYLAHYMLNRYPKRFTCLAVRQSNFSATVLDPAMTPRSLYHPVLVLGTENDFAICKRESREAIAWYERHGYKNLAWVYMRDLGHARTPDTAADFFARVAGVKPNSRPDVLAERQAIGGNATGLALLAGNMDQLQRPPAEVKAGDDLTKPTEGRLTQRPPASMVATPRVTQARATTPRWQAPAEAQAPSRATEVTIRVSSAIGFDPLLLVYSAECPADWHRSADFYWTLDGRNIGHGVNGQRTIVQPGDHKLELLVVTQDGTEHRAARRVRVLRNADTPSGG